MKHDLFENVTALHRVAPRVCFNVLRINLWRLFADFSRIDDEFERIRVLILFYQLQIDEPLSAFERIAAAKLCFCGFDQIRCHLILPVCGKTVRGSANLRLGEGQIVKVKFRVSGSCPCNRCWGSLLTITAIASSSPCRSPSSSNGAPRYGMITSPMNITLSSGR